MRTKNKRQQKPPPRQITTKTEVQKYIVLPDLHVPEHDAESLRAVNQFIYENPPWSGLIYLGDVLDMNCISSHNENNLRAVEGQRLLNDHKLADELVLKPHEQIIRGSNSAARIIWIQGNHGERVCRWVVCHEDRRSKR
jgi:hypothetical protein